MANFDVDYHLLKNYPKKKEIFHLSKNLKPEILQGGLDRYSELYSYF